MPYISAFNKDGRASIILGVIISPSVAAVAWSSRNVDLRLGMVIGLEGTEVLFESALRLRAIPVSAQPFGIKAGNRDVVFFCWEEGVL
jgi:hypothetical protein